MNTWELKIFRARELRTSQTEAERVLWSSIRNHRLDGFGFRRQHPIGAYFVDFVCLGQRLVVELDGGQHLESVEHDEKRTEFLNESGFQVIRFWNNQVMAEIGGVKEAILLALTQSRKRPPPP
jgi:very-short-patch-repair endonuclease